MCGRIAQCFDPEKVRKSFDIRRETESIEWATPSYNIAPGSKIHAFQLNEHQDKSWMPLTWGMRPVWAKMKRPIINARAETVLQKPMFRDAFQTRRSLIPVTAYYEWRTMPQGKQPYCIRNKNGEPLFLAGLYTENEGVILTQDAQEDISFIHDRMPVVVVPERMDAYLSEAYAARKVIRNRDHLDLDVYPVTKEVGHAGFDHPTCLKPVDHV